MKKTIFSMAVLMMGLAFTACSSDDDNNGDNKHAEKEQAMQAITDQYVNNVVFPIYKSLASQTSTLYDQLVEAKSKFRAGTLSQSDIDRICDTFIAARSAWEQSESFLYGAATDNDIDPHIDSWPLDHSQLVEALNNASIIAGINGSQPDKYVYEQNKDFGSVLGFHGLEFILFRNGANRTLAALTADYETETGLTTVKTLDECAFAAAISGDLRNMTSLLAYGWIGSSASSSILNVINTASWVVEGTRFAGLTSKGVSYGEAVIGATTSVGLFTTWQETLSNIYVGGCSKICQEVYTQKLGQAYRVATGQGEAEDAADYIESPYSKRSFQDYQDNIYSIKHSLYGNRDDNSSTPESNSLMAFMKNKNYSGYETLNTALNEAIASLETAKNSGKAFIDAPGDAQVKTCIDKIQALDEALNSAGAWVQKQATE